MCRLENVDWWENQDFTPEVLFDHEIYTRKNDDEVGGDESTSLRLTLQDFVGPGTSVAGKQKLYDPLLCPRYQLS